MAINTSVIDHLPAKAARSARQSDAADIVEKARSAAPRYVLVNADTKDELTKIYKILIQFRMRHQLQSTLKMRKVGSEIFIWFVQGEADAA